MESDLPTSLYDFYENLPSVIRIKVHKEVIESHSVRGLILKILKTGLKEKTNTNKEIQRYALNVTEILNLLKKEGVKKINKTNLYFHINKLKKANLIKIVDTPILGKIRTAYYSRTAKVILMDDLGREEYYIKLFKQFRLFLKNLNQNVNEKNLEKLSKDYLALTTLRENKIASWMAKNNQGLQSEINNNEIFEFLKIIDGADQSRISLINKIKKEIPIEFDFK